MRTRPNSFCIYLLLFPANTRDSSERSNPGLSDRCTGTITIRCYRVSTHIPSRPKCHQVHYYRYVQTRRDGDTKNGCVFSTVKNILYYYLYQSIWRKAINLCIRYCLAEVPGCEQYYKNIVRSLFLNGRQRAEIAIP